MEKTEKAVAREVDKDKMTVAQNVLEICLKSIGALLLLIGAIIMFYGMYLHAGLVKNGSNDLYPSYLVTGGAVLGTGVLTYTISEIQTWIKLSQNKKTPN